MSAIKEVEMFSRDEILNIISSQMGKLKADYSVNQMGLFGSAVRGELTVHSDIDILVDLTEPTFDHYMDLKFYLEDLLGLRVDLVTSKALRKELKIAIEKDLIHVS